MTFEQLLEIGTVVFHPNRRFQTTASRPQIQFGRPFLPVRLVSDRPTMFGPWPGPNVGLGSGRLIVVGRANDATNLSNNVMLAGLSVKGDKPGGGEWLPALVNQG